MITLTEPPESPDPANRYLVGAGASGAWAGRDGQLARWNWTLGYWEFYYSGVWSADPNADTTSVPPPAGNVPAAKQPWPMPTATETILGGIKASESVRVAEDGTATLNPDVITFDVDITLIYRTAKL